VRRVLPLLLTIALAGVGCARDKQEHTASVEQASSEWSQRVRHAHELTDKARSEGERRVAIAALRQVLRDAPPPATPRVQWVLQDLQFRLALALVDNKEHESALTVVEQGLNMAQEPTLARANLLALQGKVFELQGKPGEAARALHEALLINEVLLERALEGEAEPERQ
jgi:hypothetical protein